MNVVCVLLLASVVNGKAICSLSYEFREICQIFKYDETCLIHDTRACIPKTYYRENKCPIYTCHCVNAKKKYNVLVIYVLFFCTGRGDNYSNSASIVPSVTSDTISVNCPTGRGDN